MAADYSGSEPDPGYAFDGDGNLVKESENGSVKAYYVRSTLLNATIAELTATGALEEGAVLSNTGSRIAVLKNSEFHFYHVDPSGSYEKHIKVDKSTASKTQYDPTGRKNNYPGPTGAGPCGSFCPPPYNPPGGFDGLAILQARIRQQRWQDTYLSLLPRYAYHGIVIGMDPPYYWDPSDSQEDLVNWNLLDSHHERYGMLPRPDGYASVSYLSSVPMQDDWAALIVSQFDIVNENGVDYLHFRGIEGARGTLGKFLEYNDGECSRKLNEALNKLVSTEGIKNRGLRGNDILAVFNAVDSQPVGTGGLYVNQTEDSAYHVLKLFEVAGSDRRIAGGGGMTAPHSFRLNGGNRGPWGFGAFVFQYKNGAISGHRRYDYMVHVAGFKNLVTLVHELFHGAGVTGNYNDAEIDLAARAVDKDVRNLDGLIEKYCVPKQYH